MIRRAWWQPDDGAACGLLVSVRDEAEAAEAVIGGATIIDVKEPDHGPLGRASAPQVAAVARIALAARRPWTMAGGELRDGPSVIMGHVADVGRRLGPDDRRPTALKVGLAGMGDSPAAWSAGIGLLATGLGDAAGLVAVAYVDWQRAAAPEPGAVVAVAARHGCRMVLFDSFDKQGPGSLDDPGADRLAAWFGQAREAGLAVALAGRITAASLPAALALRPAVLGFRSAACEGGRSGRVSGKLVARLGTLCRPAAVETGGTTSGVRV